MEKVEFHVTGENAGRRIDLHASEMSGITRSQIQHLIEKGLVTVNHFSVKQNYRTKPGDLISITIPEESEKLAPENIPIEILYMDDFLIVVNKPSGMVVYPSAGHKGGTLMNAVAYLSKKLSSIGGPLRPGVVHRLDKDTSGIMVIALDDSAYYKLVQQFRERTIKRKYICLIFGNLKNESGEISLRIGRSESDRKKMSTRIKRGKEAVTRWHVIERFRTATLIEAKLSTGRTHQIRVHFASIGHPVFGDAMYGRKTSIEINKVKVNFPRQMLHAAQLGFIHPSTGEYMEFSSSLPEDMENALITLRAGVSKPWYSNYS